MTICLVTDRRRRPPIEQAAEAVDAGVDLIQVRERDLETSALASLVLRVVEATRGSPTRVVVNDRVDVALACGAHGVHLRADSIPASRVRTLVPPGFVIGRSVHGRDEALAVAPGCDYVIAGTVFPTASKPGRIDLLGPDGLESIARTVRLPVLAIGGITLERAAAAAAAGAAGVAAIGLFADVDRPIKDVIRALRARFNMGGGATSSA
jgi:thiamine-phosphate pyrophosphorylase